MALQEAPAIVQASGDLGDVIKVDLNHALHDALGTLGTYSNFHLLISSFKVTDGSVAITPNKTVTTATDRDILEPQGANPFVKSGVFYFIPKLDANKIQSGDIPDPITAVGNFTYDVTINGVSEERFGAITISAQAGYTSMTLDGPVGSAANASNLPLDVDKIEQRLRYLDFRGKKLTQSGISPPVVVDGRNGTILAAGDPIISGGYPTGRVG